MPKLQHLKFHGCAQLCVACSYLGFMCSEAQTVRHPVAAEHMYGQHAYLSVSSHLAGSQQQIPDSLQGKGEEIFNRCHTSASSNASFFSSIFSLPAKVWFILKILYSFCFFLSYALFFHFSFTSFSYFPFLLSSLTFLPSLSYFLPFPPLPVFTSFLSFYHCFTFFTSSPFPLLPFLPLPVYLPPFSPSFP